MSSISNPRVFIAGCGPGDFGLVTLRVLDLVKTADCIIYDRLIPHEILQFAPSDCEMINVGKIPGNTPWPQERINNLLVEKGREHEKTVRLKGGDPYVFGRGGEETLILTQENISFEVIPGISSFSAVPALFNVPVTHRGAASCACVITGHEDPKKNESDLDYQALADFPGTLVFFMGVGNLPKIAAHLLQAGKDKDTPVAILREGYTHSHPILTATLDTVTDLLLKQKVKPPALTVIGAVVDLHKQIRQTAPAYRLLSPRQLMEWKRWRITYADSGIKLIAYPVIETLPIVSKTKIRATLKKLKEFNYLVFTSANGVRHFFEEMKSLHLDLRKLAHLKICAIGTGTLRELQDRGLEADFLPKRFIAEGLLELFAGFKGKGNVLIPRALHCRRILVDGLKEQGYNVTELKIYRTIATAPNDLSHKRVEEKNYDGVVFTSASTVRNFLQLHSLEQLENRDVFSIGPMTSKALRNAGVTRIIEAKEYSMDGILDMVCTTRSEAR